MTRNTMRICLTALIISGAFIAGMCAYLMSDKDRSDSNMPTDSAEIEQKPLCFVVLDPGHGGYDRGAQGSTTGVFEDELNLDVAQKTASILSSMNIRCELTRRDENALASKKKDDMKERRRIMHESGADLTVSIHMNKFSDKSVRGPMVFYTSGDEQSERLAACIIQSLCRQLDIRERKTNTGDYYVIRDSSIPACIVECGFLSNSAEEKLLCTDEYREKLACAIAEGIRLFSEGEGKQVQRTH